MSWNIGSRVCKCAYIVFEPIDENIQMVNDFFVLKGPLWDQA